MIIAVASGKGGTGKTTVAVNLALSLGQAKLLDCDVEEPNAYLLLGNPRTSSKTIHRLVPVVQKEHCTLCGDCARFCRYNSLFVGQQSVVVFENMCHSCGGCRVVCPSSAITEVNHRVGTMHTAYVDGISLVYGKLDIGEPAATELIRAVKSTVDKRMVNILDAPPGTACPVIETVQGSDYVILVTEPTPFGLHDLSLTIDMIGQLGIPYGVVINRSGSGDEEVEHFCSQRNIPILLEIPYSRNVAELYSRGIPFVHSMPEWKSTLRGMYDKVSETVSSA